MHPGLQNVANRAALYANLKQTLFGEVLEEQLGEHQIDGDMSAGTLRFVGAERSLTARIHLIGSVAPGPRSMLWGWAHPQGGSGVADKVKELGEKYGITDLTTAELPFEPGEDVGETVAALAHLVGYVGVEATRLSPYYTADVGGGTRAVFVLEGIEVPEPALMQVASRLGYVLSAGNITDHRSTVLGLAEHRPGFTATEDGNAIRISDETGHVEFTFDDQRRITNASMKLKGADQGQEH